MKEFKDFAVKGNVVDMAVGIIIGAAFGKIVTALVSGVIMPPIGVLVGGVNFSDLAGIKDGETVLFSFIVYKSREHRDQVNARVMNDERMKDACNPDDMPFDPSRMAFGGFKAIVDL